MNGIEILNTVTDMPEKSGGMIILDVILVILMAVTAWFSVGGAFNIIKERYLDAEGWIGIVLMSAIAVGCCVGSYYLIDHALGEKDKRETIIYATIDDTVPWTEINERYELIRQDGKIYQLRVKEDADGQ